MTSIDRDDLPATPPPASEVPPVPAATRQPSGAAIVAGIAAVLCAVGAFGPWAVGPLGTSLSGIEGSSDGWFVIGISAFALLIAWAYNRAPWRGAGIWLLLLATGNAAIAILDRSNLHDRYTFVAADGTRTPVGELVHSGWGVDLLLVAAIALGLAGGTMLARRRRRA